MSGRSVAAVVVDYGRGRTQNGAEPPESLKTDGPYEAIVVVEGDTRRQHVSGYVTGLTQWMMAEGDTIPVLVDDAGDVVGVDRPAIDELYAAQKQELKESLRDHTILRTTLRDLGIDREQLSDIGPALKDLASVPRQLIRAIREPTDTPAPTTEPAPPIDGVSFTTFVTVQAALVRDRVPPERHDEVAATHGVTAGGWGPAQDAWMRLVRTDPAVGQAFGAAYAAAIKG